MLEYKLRVFRENFEFETVSVTLKIFSYLNTRNLLLNRAKR